MYPRQLGEELEYVQVFRPQHGYGEDDTSVTVHRMQQYGDDGITDGAEGLGVVQAQRLKAKLMGRRRALRVGRRPYDQFGIAPLVAVAAAGKGVSVFKRLTTTPAHKVAAKSIPALVTAVKQGSIDALQALHHGARSAATVAAKSAYYKALEDIGGSGDRAVSGILTPGPAWRGKNAAMQAGALIMPGMWEFKAQPGMLTPPSTTPIAPPGIPQLFPVPKPQPAPGGGVDAGGGTAPYLPQVPSPIPPSGGSPSPTEDIAAGTQPQGPTQAGMFGGLDLKALVPLAAIGFGALILSKVAGGGRRRSRR